MVRGLFQGMRGRWIAAVLKGAKRLLTNGGWVQGNEARNVRGELTWWPLATDAVAWSLEGALLRAANDLCRERNVLETSRRNTLNDWACIACEMELSAAHAGRRYPLAEFNDDPLTTWGDVLAVLTRAIERCERESLEGV